MKSLLDNGVQPNSNVYAELGSTWRGVMSDPTQAAHVLGKLLKYVGEDNVCWGTDCIWYGAPQPQIVAFRAFEIDPELAQEHGYPQLTAEVKAKVFGLNAAKLYGIDAGGATLRDPAGRCRPDARPASQHARPGRAAALDEPPADRPARDAALLCVDRRLWSPWRVTSFAVTR